MWTDSFVDKIRSSESQKNREESGEQGIYAPWLQPHGLIDFAPIGSKDPEKRKGREFI